MGALVCTACSVCTMLSFLIVLSALLLMPGGAKQRQMKGTNGSYVGPVGSDVSSSSTLTDSLPSSLPTASPSSLPDEEPWTEPLTTATTADKTTKRKRKTRTTKATTLKASRTTSTEVESSPEQPAKEPETGEKSIEADMRTTMKTHTTTTTAKAVPTTKLPRTSPPTTSAGPTTTTVKPMPYNSLICVLNADMSQKAVSELPEDGLCNFAFYQAYEKEHAILKGPGGPFATSLELIVQAASQHNRTEYGISFDFLSMSATEPLLSQNIARTTLENLWRKRIYHYAFLTIPFFDLDEKKYRKVYYYLKDVDKILHKGLKPPRPCYYLVGESFYIEPWINFAFNNIRERMHIHGAVVYGHLVFDDRGKGQILPPTFWNSTLINAEVYKYNLDTAHWALSVLPLKKLDYTQFFLAVTTGGRYYTPTKGDKCEILARNGYLTTEPLHVDIGQFCKNKEWSGGFREDTPMGPFFANPKIERVVTYDDERSLREKLCLGKKRIPAVKYGVAVFDANLDDPSNLCGKGAYSRVRLLKKIKDFFNENFLSANDYDECLTL